MPRNVEIKARLRDPSAVRSRVEGLSESPGEVLSQHDVLFRVPAGRFKLRALAGRTGQLIHYARADCPGPAESEYVTAEVDDPGAVQGVLSRALGILGTVTKRRCLYQIGQTRVHLDEVDGLGDFVELEVVLADGQSAAEGADVARKLMRKLGVMEADLVKESYLDLLNAS